ncbi:PleD family two-component response regulator [Rhizobium sp. SG741]|nr:PleD family two-component response regulator [Rhizobium sp. SG741]
MAAEPVSWGEKSMAETASVGIAIGDGLGDFECVMTRADDVVYRAKRGGRNQVAA